MAALSVEDALLSHESVPFFVPLLSSLRYVYPALVFSFYIVSSAVAACTLQTKRTRRQAAYYTAVRWAILFGLFTYLIQLSILLFQSLVTRVSVVHQDTLIGLLSCTLVFGVELAGLWDSEHPVWYPYIGSCSIALVFEPVIEAFSILSLQQHALTHAQCLEITTVAVRYASFLLVLGLYSVSSYRRSEVADTDAERQPLIRKDHASNGEASPNEGDGESSQYGSTADGAKPATGSESRQNPESPWERRQRRAAEQMEKRLQEKGNWFAYVKGFRVFLPYIWPVNHTGLQIRAVLVGLCLITMNIVNLMIPRQLGIVMDSLSGADHRNPWTQVLIFAALKFTASDAGLSLFRQWLWIPVEYYSFETMSTAAYSHVLNLSSDFHDTKSSSDTMMAIQSGQNVTNVLESVFFRAIPMMVDMVIAFAYLSATFGPFEGLITVATATVFLYTATKMISGLKDARRGEVSAWFEEHYVRQAGIQGWTTVASFNQIGYEERRYASAVKNRVTKSQTVYFKYIVWYAFQYLVLLSGLLAGLFLAVYQVTHGEATAGQFIMLLTYWSQLVAPLSFFATLGKNISRDLIHAEQLLEIMQTKPTVQNKEGAPPLRLVEGGGVLFKNVHFSYDGQKEILKDVDFSVTPGTTVAIVGPTGAGKSTILKLLDRFYDVTEGSILIDGQDVHDVDITSLRAHIGIVPQSPVLFDDTVMNNIRYANLAATDEEVFEACKAASIHDQISGFTDGYNSRVGERGIKLSGGELQRLAIARAILKKPAIVLLDEATSAVDTETEQKIQEALHILCEGRTTFIVAHRLSTIMNADTIIVLSDGKVAEQGPHDVLIRANGKYANLWFKQFLPKGKTGETADNQGIRGRAMMVNGTGPSPSTGTSHISLLQRTFDGDSPCGPDIGEEETKAPSSKPDEATAAGSTTVKHEKEGSRLNPDAPAFTPGLAGSQLETPALKPKPHAPSGDEAFDPDQSLTAEDMRNGDVDQLAAAESYLPSTCPTYTQPLTTVQETCEIGTNFEENSIETAGSSGFESRPLQNLSAKSTKDEFRHPRHSRRLQSRSEPLASNPPPQQ